MRIKRKLFRIKPVRELVKLLRQGTSPHKMALSITLGLLLGVIPTFGFVTPICALLAIWLRLNVPMVLTVFYLVFPLHLALFVPFLKLGEIVFNLPRLPFSPSTLILMIREDWWHTLEMIGVNNLAALAVWGMVSIPSGFLLYGIFLLFLRKFKKEANRKAIR